MKKIIIATLILSTFELFAGAIPRSALDGDLNRLPINTKMNIHQHVFLAKLTDYKSFIKTNVNIDSIPSQIDCGFRYRKARTQDRVVYIDSMTISSEETSFALGPDFEGRYTYWDRQYVDMYQNRGVKAIHYIEFISSDSEIKIECSSTGEIISFLKISQLKDILSQANIDLQLPAPRPFEIPSRSRIVEDDFSSDSNSIEQIISGSQIVIKNDIFMNVMDDKSVIGKIGRSTCEFRYMSSGHNRVLHPGTYRIIPGGKTSILPNAFFGIGNRYYTVLTLSEDAGSELHIACGPMSVGQFRELLTANNMELLRAP